MKYLIRILLLLSIIYSSCVSSEKELEISASEKKQLVDIYDLFPEKLIDTLFPQMELNYSKKLIQDNGNIVYDYNLNLNSNENIVTGGIMSKTIIQQSKVTDIDFRAYDIGTRISKANLKDFEFSENNGFNLRADKYEVKNIFNFGEPSGYSFRISKGNKLIVVDIILHPGITIDTTKLNNKLNKL